MDGLQGTVTQSNHPEIERLDSIYHEFANFSYWFQFHNLSLSDIMFDPRHLKGISSLAIWQYVFWITLSIGVTGNLLVTFMVCKSKEMRTVTNMYLLNLAVVGILYLLVTIPNKSYWTNYWPDGEFMCKYSFSYSLCNWTGTQHFQ